MAAVVAPKVAPRRQLRRPGGRRGGRYNWGVAQTAEVHVTVGPDGSLSVAAPQLADAGIHAGDPVLVVREHRRRVRSMLGAYDRGIDFDIEDQRAIRAEMAAGLGEDLTR